MVTAPDYIRQAGTIPVRGGAVCLVTSSNGKRWVIPKGLIEANHTAGEAALQEAWEEAGLVGVLQQEPGRNYLYEKWCGTCHVPVLLMEETDMPCDCPER